MIIFLFAEKPASDWRRSSVMKKTCDHHISKSVPVIGKNRFSNKVHNQEPELRNQEASWSMYLGTGILRQIS